VPVGVAVKACDLVVLDDVHDFHVIRSSEPPEHTERS
jgi:hypothetical protein